MRRTSHRCCRIGGQRATRSRCCSIAWTSRGDERRGRRRCASDGGLGRGREDRHVGWRGSMTSREVGSAAVIRGSAGSPHRPTPRPAGPYYPLVRYPLVGRALTQTLRGKRHERSTRPQLNLDPVPDVRVGVRPGDRDSHRDQLPHSIGVCVRL